MSEDPKELHRKRAEQLRTTLALTCWDAASVLKGGRYNARKHDTIKLGISINVKKGGGIEAVADQLLDVAEYLSPNTKGAG